MIKNSILFIGNESDITQVDNFADVQKIDLSQYSYEDVNFRWQTNSDGKENLVIELPSGSKVIFESFFSSEAKYEFDGIVFADQFLRGDQVLSIYEDNYNELIEANNLISSENPEYGILYKQGYINSTLMKLIHQMHRKYGTLRNLRCKLNIILTVLMFKKYKLS